MTQKVIAIEEKDGPLRAMLQDMLRMVPDRDRDDVNLQRLLAFRLHLDGEVALKEYLMTKIRAAAQCAYTGSLYDFLRNDLATRECSGEDADGPSPDSPGAA
jgi:hypothetical protein